MKLPCTSIITDFGSVLSALRGAGILLLLALLAATGVAVAQNAPPPDGGVFVIEGAAEAKPDLNTLLASGYAQIQPFGAVPQIRLTATGVGWVYSPFPLYVVTGSTRPWRMRLESGPMLMEGNPEQRLELSNVEARDGLTPTPWVSLEGTPQWQNLNGNPEQYLQLEFRINVHYTHAPGHYVSSMTLYWQMPPMGGLPAASGTIPMELHLDVPPMMSVEMIDTVLEFPDRDGTETGWMYTNEGHFRITSNMDYSLTIFADDLTTMGDPESPSECQMDTALRLRMPLGSGSGWQTWGELGDDEADAGGPPWSISADTGSPWPGDVRSPSSVIETVGVNHIGLTGAAWRRATGDRAGEYSTTVKISVAVN